MFSIVLFGAPGAGKGTQSKMLVEKYDLTYISTGEMLRKEIAAQSPIGLQAKDIINKGELVTDEMIVRLIEKTVRETKQQGILFDGFPRNVVQAYILEGFMHRINGNLLGCLSLEVPKETLVQRMLNRAKIEGRADDKEDVIMNRFKEYENKTLPVADFYKGENMYYPVCGTGSVDEVFSRLTKIIDSKL